MKFWDKDKQRKENELRIGDVNSDDPLSLLEAKRQHYAEKWCEGADSSRLLQALSDIRGLATASEPTEFTMDMLNATLARMKTATGRGCDNLGPADLRALPPAGKQAALDMLTYIDQQLAWPWQLLLSIVTLLK